MRTIGTLRSTDQAEKFYANHSIQVSGEKAPSGTTLGFHKTIIQQCMACIIEAYNLQHHSDDLRIQFRKNRQGTITPNILFKNKALNGNYKLISSRQYVHATNVNEAAMTIFYTLTKREGASTGTPDDVSATDLRPFTPPITSPLENGEEGFGGIINSPAKDSPKQPPPELTAEQPIPEPSAESTSEPIPEQTTSDLIPEQTPDESPSPVTTYRTFSQDSFRDLTKPLNFDLIRTDLLSDIDHTDEDADEKLFNHLKDLHRKLINKEKIDQNPLKKWKHTINKYGKGSFFGSDNRRKLIKELFMLVCEEENINAESIAIATSEFMTQISSFTEE